LALSLSSAGYRVLVLERGRRLGNTLSTHFVWPRGASYLAQLGVLEQVAAVTPSGEELELRLEDVVLRGAVPAQAVADRHRALHGEDPDPSQVTQRFFSVRRQVLDPLLLEAAQAAGAEVRMGHTVTGLVRDGDRVTGVTFRDSAGHSGQVEAKLVVGADGRRSTVAKHLALAPRDVRQKCTFAMWSYFGGFRPERPTLARKGRLGAAVVPTNDGVNMTLVFGPSEWFEAFKRDREAHFTRALQLAAPDLAEQVASQGERAEGWYATHEMAGFNRKTHGPGWALVGDAATVKDQCTAIGMTHAFRDAALLAQHAGAAFAGEGSLDDALDRYSGARYRDSTDYYDFVGLQAEVKPLDDATLELATAASLSPKGTGDFLAAFSDTSPLRRFFSRSNRVRLTRALARTDVRPPLLTPEAIDAYYVNPFAGERGPHRESPALTRTVVDFARPIERSLPARAEAYHAWRQHRIDNENWNFTRTLHAAPKALAPISGADGRKVAGINLGSQDYLSLSSHPAVHEAARQALDTFGVHSAGSPLLVGNTTLTASLEKRIGEHVGAEHVALFPTGWAAGYGAVSAFIRDADYILLDRYAHACLQQGASAATRNIFRYQHLDTDTARYWLDHIRSRDRHAAILVVTEGLFSMDSDVPDLRALQEVCRAYDATLLVDVAHDLGSMGPGGTGSIGAQGLLGDVDIVMGSFSKTFASNGGFVATNHAPMREYLRMFASPHVFSNALSPIQVACIDAAFRIVMSEEGDRLREASQAAIGALRDGISRRGGVVLGDPSPIVPVLLGDERLARVAYRMLVDRDLCGNMVEFPGVASGMSRFRLQVMAAHTPAQMEEAAEHVVDVIEAARSYLMEEHHLDIPAPGSVRIAGGSVGASAAK